MTRLGLPMIITDPMRGKGLGTGPTFVNVCDFGADKRGIVDCSASIRRAITAAIDTGNNRGPHRAIYFPKGRYLITEDNVFGYRPDVSTFFKNLTFIGEGRANSQILLQPPTAAAIWLFNNTGAGQQATFYEFYSMGFFSVGDHKAYGNGFNFVEDQFFTWHDSDFYSFDELVVVGSPGKINGPCHRFYTCRISQITKNILRLNNIMSVGHEFYGCTIWNLHGDVIYIDEGGGGEVRFFGGEIDRNNVDGDTDMHYLVNCSPGEDAVIAKNNGSFEFYSTKFEFQDEYQALIYKDDSLNGIRVNFIGNNMMVLQGGAREVVTVNNTCQIRFLACDIPAEFTYQLTGVADTLIPNIQFMESWIPANLRSAITINTAGRADIINCLDADSKDQPKNFHLGFWNLPEIALTTVSTAGAGEDDLHSAIIPENSHLENTLVKLKAAGTKTGANDTKEVKLYFGTDSWTVIAAVNDELDWRIEAEIVLTAAATQRISWVCWNGTTVAQGYETGTQDLSAGDVRLKLTGQCANAGDQINNTMFEVTQSSGER